MPRRKKTHAEKFPDIVVFFVSPAIIRGAVELAKEKSVLGVNSNWLG
jgi:hypothetical protein